MVYKIGKGYEEPCSYRFTDRQPCKCRAEYTIVPDIYGPQRLLLCGEHGWKVMGELLALLGKPPEKKEA